jgi:hypothetical protein
MRGTRFVRLAVRTALCIVLRWRIGVGHVLATFGFRAGLMIGCGTLGWRGEGALV